MVKALVTGGTGFVGSHVVRQLIDAGHQVRVLYRTTSKLTALDGLDYEAAIGTLSDRDALQAACEGIDWVFHIAAVADYWRADKSRMFVANVEGTRNVLRAARHAGVKRVVFTSSAAAIGLHNNRPSHEKDRFNLPPQQFPYGYSKHLAEQVVAEAVRDGLEVITVNPVVVMGPGDLNMISGSFVKQIKQLGPLVPVTSGGIAVADVRDVARWHILAAEKGQSGERYILGTSNHSYSVWYGMIADAVGVRRPFLMLPDFVAPIVANVIALLRQVGVQTVVDATQARMGVQNIYFDYQKTWDVFGVPKIDMRQSLADTTAWYREHGYL